ncbi:MAG TPA: alpha-1,6-glucosidase domain-containing protein, partial [Flavisolibacter sp.]
KESNEEAPEEELIKMDKLAQTIAFTSQGVAFLHSGAELLRTKQGVHNSYNSPDSINEIDWSRKVKYRAVFDYYKGLVALRKNHPAFRMLTATMIREKLQFLPVQDPLFIAYQIAGVKDDKWKNIIVLLNGNKEGKAFSLPKGRWVLAVDGNTIKENGIRKISGNLTVPPTSAFILYKEE